MVPALSLRKGDMVLAEDNDPVPGDGEIEEGVALVDESAVTGESAPVIREAKGDRTGVTGGTHASFPDESLYALPPTRVKLSLTI